MNEANMNEVNMTEASPNTSTLSPFKSRSGLARLQKALGYSLRGLQAAWQFEAAFRQELMAILILLPLAFYLGENNTEKALLLGSLFLVLIVELLNSAVESVVDRVGLEAHELSGRAKDIGSAAVLLALIASASIWLLVLL